MGKDTDLECVLGVGLHCSVLCSRLSRGQKSQGQKDLIERQHTQGKEREKTQCPAAEVLKAFAGLRLTCVAKRDRDGKTNTCIGHGLRVLITYAWSASRDVKEVAFGKARRKDAWRT